MEKFGSQVAQLTVSIVIARILDPSEYGSVSMLTVFIQIATVFVQSGLSSALIQKADADETDRSSVFFYSLGMATLVYLLLFSSSGLIAQFYGMPELSKLLKVQALILFPGAINSLQVSILSKRLEFRKQFFSSITAVLVSGATGIGLALSGYGPWALVGQQLVSSLVTCAVLWRLVAWRPHFVFSFKKTKALLSFGIKLLGANLVDTLYHNLESLIIGKKFSASTLAFCDKGKMFPLILINNIDGSLQSVMFPMYSMRQEDMIGLKRMLRRTLSMSTYLVFPLMTGLAAAAVPVIDLVLGDKWLGAVPFLRMYCLIASLFPFQTAPLQALNAIGRSDLYLRAISMKRSVGLILLGIAALVFNTPYAVVATAIAAEIAGTIFSMQPMVAIFNYSPNEQLKDALKSLLLSAVMGISVYAVGQMNFSYFVMLLIQVIVGVILYAFLSYATNNENFAYLLKVLSARSSPFLSRFTR